MKNLFRLLMAALVICATSCTKEDISSTVVGNGEVVEVNFSANLSELGTRVTTGSGAAADRLLVNVFDAANGNQLTELSRTDTRSSKDESFNFSLPLVKGMTYNIVLWADMGDDSIYTLKGKVVTANYSAAVKSNDENLDAFCFVFKGFDPTNPAHSPHFTLRRPFAQLNAATNDKAAVTASGIELTTSEVKVLAYNQFDIFEGTVPQGATKAEVTFGAANIPGGDLNGNATYEYLSANYLFVPATGALTDAVYTFKGKKTNSDVVTFTGTSYSAIPLKPNHRTNILGALLTKPADFVVDINAGFTDSYDHVIWDGKSVSEPDYDATTQTYTIDNGSELAWLAEQVNAGETFSGKTFNLTNDIDLNNMPWTPIGLGESSTPFSGTLDGAKATRSGDCYTIRNLYVAPTKGEYTAAGLFGRLRGCVKNLVIDGAYVEHTTSGNADGNTTNGIAVVAGSTYNSNIETAVENVTVKNATVKGNRYVAGIVGFADNSVKNCTVESSEFILSCDNLKGSWDNADKGGSIIGYSNTTNYEFQVNVTGCVVKDVTITGYRDLGGIIGYARGNISGNTIESVEIFADNSHNYKNYTEASKYDLGSIYGEKADTAVVEDNTGEATMTIIYTGELNAIELSEPYNYVFDNLKVVVTEGPAGKPAVQIAKDNEVTITLVGNVVVESAVGSGINATDATLTLVGGKLTAKGNGDHAFGIGGNGATVTLDGVTVDYVCGGHIQPLCVNDPKYGKGEPEGGAAIGGAVVNILNSTITKADGGSKAAAIGAQYWQSAIINIENSTIVEANGGNASAGIGGSRYAGDNKYDLEINIKNSDVTATGGQFGAGIGSGYDTHCNQNNYTATNKINIDATSTVNATGGKYAAGIGTGYHSAYLTGAIAAGANVTAVSGDIYYKDAYTTAQNIGYGVVDPSREFSGANTNVTLTVADEVIPAPTVKAMVDSADALKAAIDGGATTILLSNSGTDYDLNGIQKNGLTLIGYGDGVEIANTTKYASGKSIGAIWKAINLENMTIKNTVYTMADGGNATFEDVTFAAGFRQGYGRGVVFTNCAFGSNSDGYALHFQTDSQSEGGVINLTGCKFNGGKVHLGGKRTYVFSGCEFADGTDFQVWSNISLENCTVDGVAVTASNISTLFPNLNAAMVTLK